MQSTNNQENSTQENTIGCGQTSLPELPSIPGLDKGRLKRLIESVSFGMSLSGACGLCRISAHKLRDAIESCPELADALAEAEGQAEQRLLALSLKAAEADGAGAIKLLERRFPAQWAREGTVRHEHVHGASSDFLKALTEGRAKADRMLAERTGTIEVKAEPLPSCTESQHKGESPD